MSVWCFTDMQENTYNIYLHSSMKSGKVGAWICVPCLLRFEESPEKRGQPSLSHLLFCSHSSRVLWWLQRQTATGRVHSASVISISLFTQNPMGSDSEKAHDLAETSPIPRHMLLNTTSTPQLNVTFSQELITFKDRLHCMSYWV